MSKETPRRVYAHTDPAFPDQEEKWIAWWADPSKEIGPNKSSISKLGSISFNPRPLERATHLFYFDVWPEIFDRCVKGKTATPAWRIHHQESNLNDGFQPSCLITDIAVCFNLLISLN